MQTASGESRSKLLVSCKTFIRPKVGIIHCEGPSRTLHRVTSFIYIFFIISKHFVYILFIGIHFDKQNTYWILNESIYTEIQMNYFSNLWSWIVFGFWDLLRQSQHLATLAPTLVKIKGRRLRGCWFLGSSMSNCPNFAIVIPVGCGGIGPSVSAVISKRWT